MTDLLTVNGITYMTDLCLPVSRLMGRIAYGRVLQLGYGLGVTDGILYKNRNVTKTTTVEREECKLPGVIRMDVADYIGTPGPWDCIIWGIDNDELLHAEDTVKWIASECKGLLIAETLGPPNLPWLKVTSGEANNGLWLTVYELGQE